MVAYLQLVMLQGHVVMVVAAWSVQQEVGNEVLSAAHAVALTLAGAEQAGAEQAERGAQRQVAQPVASLAVVLVVAAWKVVEGPYHLIRDQLEDLAAPRAQPLRVVW